MNERLKHAGSVKVEIHLITVSIVLIVMNESFYYRQSAPQLNNNIVDKVEETVDLFAHAGYIQLMTLIDRPYN